MSELVHAFTLMFVASSLLLFVMNRFSHPAVPAYILAGIAVGGMLQTEQVLGFSQIGIAFLVFVFGLKLDLERLNTVAKEAQFTTTLQVGILGVLTYFIGIFLGLDTLNALYFSVAASLSSSLVGMELIEKEVRLDLLHGRLAESIQLIQDLIAIVAVAVLTAGSTTEAIMVDLALVVGLLALGWSIRKQWIDSIAKNFMESRELVLFVSLAFLTGFAALADFLGLSIVIGSFAAGFSLARFPHNLEILDTVGPLKDFFSALFFISLGALLTVPSIETLAYAAILSFVTLVLKPLVTASSLMTQGFDSRTSYLTGLSLDQVSEFALILAIQAFIASSIAPELFHAVILAATFTMVVSSYTTRHEEEIYDFLSGRNIIEPSERQIEDWVNVDGELEDHVILVGYDTQGRRLAEALKKEGKEFVVLENDPEKVEEVREHEEMYVFGDAMDGDSWKRVNVEKADLIVSTVPLRKISEEILSIETEADVILRAQTVEEASDHLRNGALYVNVSKILASEELVDHIVGVMENREYREELRRKSLLDVRRFLESRQG